MIRHTLICLMTVLPLSVAQAQSTGHNHGAHAASQPVLPVEGGQDAFSAIAEIVDLLRADPDTDWSTVNIDALREHLMDMNLLIHETRVQTQDVPGGASFQVEAEGRARDAVQRMMVAHAPFLAGATGWQATAEPTAQGARLTVVATVAGEEDIIRALGFFGLMATDSHHQAHHLALATGQLEH